MAMRKDTRQHLEHRDRTFVEGRRACFDFDLFGDDGRIVQQVLGHESLMLESLTTQVAHALSPEDLANTVPFLPSPLADQVQGHTLVIDSGVSIQIA